MALVTVESVDPSVATVLPGQTMTHYPGALCTTKMFYFRCSALHPTQKKFSYAYVCVRCLTVIYIYILCIRNCTHVCYATELMCQRRLPCVVSQRFPPKHYVPGSLLRR